MVILSALIIIVFRSYFQKRKANFIISKQKEIVESKNKEIVDSINYAKYIQNAILPSDTIINNLPFDCSVLFKPKDIVSGDFYWIHQSEACIYIAVVDCTGHGVPGALVSVVGNNSLNRCVDEFKLTDTGKILDKLSQLVEETFDKSDKDIKDGMDISLLAISLSTNNQFEVQWSGANNPLWILKYNTSIIEEVKANKQPIGKFDNRVPFTTHQFKFNKGDQLYAFTDGYADQFGGEKAKKFKYKQLENTLLSIKDNAAQQQTVELNNKFMSWKNSLEQVDDVCFLNIKF